MSDRDSVILSTQKELSNGAIKIELTAQPNSYPLQPDMVRIEKLSGYWLLEKVSDKRFSENEITQITLEISAEPGGQIPSWVANNMVIDMPFYTLTNLKERLENSY